MGNKDNPRRQLRNKFIAGSIGALLIAGGGYAGNVLHDQSKQIKKQDGLIHGYQQKLVEQGSLIDQQENDLVIQKKKVQQLDKKVQGLHKDLKKAEKDKKLSDAAHQKKIKKLQKDLSFKRASEAKKAVAVAQPKEVESKVQTQSVSTPTVSRKKEARSAGRTVTVEATAYTAMCAEGCTGITRTGINLKDNPHAKVIAVDPSVISLGSHVYVPGYGNAIAGDTGGAINGYKIDLHMATEHDTVQWGRRTVQIKVLD